MKVQPVTPHLSPDISETAENLEKELSADVEKEKSPDVETPTQMGDLSVGLTDVERDRSSNVKSPHGNVCRILIYSKFLELYMSTYTSHLSV